MSRKIKKTFLAVAGSWTWAWQVVNQSCYHTALQIMLEINKGG